MMKWLDGQAFAPYEEWECHAAGFHAVGPSEAHVVESWQLYRDVKRLAAACSEVLSRWPITVAVHLSQRRNHAAWMGHAACFLHHGAGAQSSVEAYWRLTEAGRCLANRTVLDAVKAWELENVEHLQKEYSRAASGQLEFPF